MFKLRGNRVRLIGIWKHNGILVAFVDKAPGEKNWPFFSKETSIPYSELEPA